MQRLGSTRTWPTTPLGSRRSSGLRRRRGNHIFGFTSVRFKATAKPKKSIDEMSKRGRG